MILISALFNQIIFYIIVVLVSVLLIFLFIYPLIKHYRESHHFKNVCYKKIYAIAMFNDYYLINNLPIIKDNEIVAQIDHVLFSNKFMYVIKDIYFNEIVNGNIYDKVWLLYNKNGKTSEINNPLMLNSFRCDKFSESKHIDRSFFISIVLVNDDIMMKNFDTMHGNNSYLCKRKDLAKLIKKIEKRNVSSFNAESLDKEVKSIADELGRKY